jgi:hypothetical protein
VCQQYRVKVWECAMERCRLRAISVMKMRMLGRFGRQRWWHRKCMYSHSKTFQPRFSAFCGAGSIALNIWLSILVQRVCWTYRRGLERTTGGYVPALPAFGGCSLPTNRSSHRVLVQSQEIFFNSFPASPLISGLHCCQLISCAFTDLPADESKLNESPVSHSAISL